MNYFKQNTCLSLLFLLLSALLFSCSGPSTEAEVINELAFTQNDFVVKRGVNISHWLSQSSRRGKERAGYFTEADMEIIDSIGYDHIRIPIDEEQMWDEEGQKESAAFDLLHDAIGWAAQRGLRVIVDLHILRSHHFNAEEKPLWTDPAARETFFQCWRDLSAELRRYPNILVAYELMNEPVADDPEEWNALVAAGVAIVRQEEPQRYIVIGSNRWQSVHTFDELRIPENDPNIILSFHFYLPFPLTHYQTSWTWLEDYDGPVHYPGYLIKPEELDTISPEFATRLQDDAKVYNRDSLLVLMQKPLRKARETGLKLYCGEWGCYPSVPRPDLLAWYRDVRYCLESNNIGWTNWDYKGGFGVVDSETGQPIADLVKVLLED